MPNGSTHQIAGALAGFAICVLDNSKNAQQQDPLLATITGAILGKLPDQLEPALNPSHRQFFHSFIVLIGGIYGLKKTYEWQPDTPTKILIRQLLLIGGSAYISHLLLDSLTPKSIPLVGSI